MSLVTIFDRWGLRGGTAANLAAVNEVPLVREGIIETDTGRIKVGDGVTPYNSLPYVGMGKIDFTGLVDGNVLVWDEAAGLFKPGEGGGGGGGAGNDPSTETYVFDEFGLVGNWTTTTSGSGSGASQLGPTDGRYGVTEVKTGTLTTGACFYSDPVGQAIKLGGGTEVELHYFFKTDVLPDATNNYALNIGLISALGGTINDRLVLRCSNDVNGGNWTIRTQVGTTVGTDVNGSFGPAASTWYRARIVANAAGTEASVYVRPKGGSEQLVGTTTNITTAALYNVFLIAKTAGTTSRSLFCDAAARWHRYTPER